VKFFIHLDEKKNIVVSTKKFKLMKKELY